MPQFYPFDYALKFCRLLFSYKFVHSSFWFSPHFIIEFEWFIQIREYHMIQGSNEGSHKWQNITRIRIESENMYSLSKKKNPPFFSLRDFLFLQIFRIVTCVWNWIELLTSGGFWFYHRTCVHQTSEQQPLNTTPIILAKCK